MVDPFTRYDMTTKEYVRSDLRDSKMLLKFEHHGVYHKVSNIYVFICYTGIFILIGVPAWMGGHATQ
jgi:hypothetical protein